jgi:HPt (histidine-containing phosphotransfer) domain-containing protein
MPANPDAIARAKELLKQLWEQHKPTVFERLALMEHAAAACLEMDEAALEEARGAAHKLAGALGTFGFQEGTELARESEQIFVKDNLDASDRQKLIEHARNIRALLESTDKN